ncbi:hypothetical protein Tco_0612473 [Tanacetum coccineum]
MDGVGPMGVEVNRGDGCGKGRWGCLGGGAMNGTEFSAEGEKMGGKIVGHNAPSLMENNIDVGMGEGDWKIWKKERVKLRGGGEGGMWIWVMEEN